MIFLFALFLGIITSLPIGILGSYIVNQVLERGFWAGFSIALLAAFFDFFYCFGTLVGIHFLASLPLLRIFLQFIGLFFLIYLGWQNFFLGKSSWQERYFSKNKINIHLQNGLFVLTYYFVNPTIFVFWFNLSSILHSYFFQGKGIFLRLIFSFFVFLGDLLANAFFLSLSLRIKKVFSFQKIKKINGFIYFIGLFIFFLYLVNEVVKLF